MKEKEEKKLCAFRLKQSTIESIKRNSESMKCSQADFIEYLTKHYDKDGYLNHIEDIVKRTHKSISYIDIYSQRILEMLNMMCFSLSCRTTISDDKIKTEIYEAAKELVKERIKKARLNSNDNLY